MAVRMYLFAMRTSAHVAMARYMATDDPRNLALWATRDPFTRTQNPPRVAGADTLPPFAGSIAYGTLRERVADYRRYLADPAAEAQLNATSWAWCDITGWRDQRLSDEEKTATIPPAMATLLTSPSPVMLTQWAHPMDAALAGAWLARARQVTPDDIAGMAPRDQHDAIVRMWGAFANYWKALNLSVQAWGKYRDAWEAATRTGVGVVLMSNQVVMPRPCASLIGFGQNDPRYTGPQLYERIGPWRTEALLVNNIIARAASSNYQRPLADMSSWGAGFDEERFLFGNTAAPQPLGSGQWGEPPPSSRQPESMNWREAQELVVTGSTAFGPMRGSHYVWVNNDAIMVGGMAPYWHGVTGDDMGGWQMSVVCPADAPDVTQQPAIVRHALDSQYNIAGDRSRYINAPAPGWTTGYLTSNFDEIPLGGSMVEQPWGSAAAYELEGATWVPAARLMWQPPPKRYVDLLWPLLEYLATQDPRAIAHEVMLDVLGKNTFTIIASGISGGTEAVQSALNQAIGQDRRATVTREARADAIGSMVRGVTTGLISTVASIATANPLAGAAVGAGFNALFAVMDAADLPSTESDVKTAGSYDVFGRIDGVPTRTGKLIGAIERYALQPMESPDADQAVGPIYSSINQRSQNTDGELFWPAGFVFPDDGNAARTTRYVPWPVGYEFLQTNEPRDRSQPVAMPSPLVASVINVRPLPVVRRVQLPQTAAPGGASGPSPAVTVGVGVAVGAALGLVVASRQPRSNPRSRTRRRRP